MNQAVIVPISNDTNHNAGDGEAEAIPESDGGRE